MADGTRLKTFTHLTKRSLLGTLHLRVDFRSKHIPRKLPPTETARNHRLHSTQSYEIPFPLSQKLLRSFPPKKQSGVGLTSFLNFNFLQVYSLYWNLIYIIYQGKNNLYEGKTVRLHTTQTNTHIQLSRLPDQVSFPIQRKSTTTTRSRTHKKKNSSTTSNFFTLYLSFI